MAKPTSYAVLLPFLLTVFHAFSDVQPPTVAAQQCQVATQNESFSVPTVAPVQPVEAPPPESFGAISTFLNMLVILGLVIALTYLVVHKGFGRMFTRTSTQSMMRLRERVVLDAKSTLFLVEVLDQQFVIGSGNGQLTLVAKIGEPQCDISQHSSGSDMIITHREQEIRA